MEVYSQIDFLQRDREKIQVHSNKGMQSDQNARYACILAADAGRYVADLIDGK